MFSRLNAHHTSSSIGVPSRAAGFRQPQHLPYCGPGRTGTLITSSVLTALAARWSSFFNGWIRRVKRKSRAVTPVAFMEVSGQQSKTKTTYHVLNNGMACVQRFSSPKRNRKKKNNAFFGPPTKRFCRLGHTYGLQWEKYCGKVVILRRTVSILTAQTKYAQKHLF